MKFINHIRGILPKVSLLNVLGIGVILVIWWLISALELINPRIMPSPAKTWAGFLQLWNDNRDANKLGSNIWYSLKINFGGYFFSVLCALPVGFILGTNKTTRSMFEPIVNSLRFIPITAVAGIFIALTGLSIWTKINFLAFGIWVYLVPVVVQRCTEVAGVQLQMMQTLGATKWQTFKFVIWRYTMSRLIDDIRILVGISWTYIIFAEMKNMELGLGRLIFLGEKQATPGTVYALIILIVIIGIIQDVVFKLLDRLIHKFKYV